MRQSVEKTPEFVRGRMSEQSGGNGHMDPAAWSQAMARIAEQSQRLVAEFVQRNQFQNASGVWPETRRSSFDGSPKTELPPPKAFERSWDDTTCGCAG